MERASRLKSVSRLQALGKFTHHHREVERAQTRKEPFSQRYQVSQCRDVRGDHCFKAGSLHLHGHVTPVLHCRLMHLGDGGGGQRRFAERCEQLRQRGAQFDFDRRAHLVNAHRRQLVVQQLQLIDVGVRQQVAPHREHLSEFEKGQPQFLEGFPNLFRRRPMSLAEQGSQELVSGEHAQDLHESRHRSPHTAFLRVNRYSQARTPTAILRSVPDARYSVRFDHPIGRVSPPGTQTGVT